MTKGKINTKSLEDVNASVDTTARKGFWKKLFSFLGPAYLVSVGYMDPGNWATDIAGGSRFQYSLLWILLMSNLIALLLQSLSARLGLVTGRDLAQASRENYPPIVNYSLYVLAEIAIAACDLAEVLGMAIGLQLLFDIPLLWGVCISVLDTFLLLFLINYGIRKMEAFILSLVFIIGVSFLFEIVVAKPDLAAVATGFIPSALSDQALYIAIGIIGATVMPHNLYLHSSLVQTRKIDRSEAGIKKAIKYNIIDSTIALNFAFFVNAAILILAASVFFKHGYYDIAEIQDAHKLLEPLLGSSLAPILFAVALIAAGQSSTITGTLAGQIVMEGYLNLRIQPWIRRILTRIIAIVPAFITIYVMGEDSTGGLLILSQVILSLQLGFAIIPLIHFVSSKKIMGTFSIGILTRTAAWISAIVIVSLNIKLVFETLHNWYESTPNHTLFYFVILPIVALALILLLSITLLPLFKKKRKHHSLSPHGTVSKLDLDQPKEFKHIAVTVDFTASDSKAINNALVQGGKKASYLLIHIVETAGALFMDKEIADLETNVDKINLEAYTNDLVAQGYDVTFHLGYGNPNQSIPEIVNNANVDLLVMGTHGHKGIKDLIFGTTVDAVRHKIRVPILIVKK